MSVRARVVTGSRNRADDPEHIITTHLNFIGYSETDTGTLVNDPNTVVKKNNCSLKYSDEREFRKFVGT